VYDNGYSIPEEYTGHGIGSNLHEEPVVYNIGNKDEGIVLRSGMTIAIEPMVHVGKKDTITLNDG
jgi:methionyl aminopeptidase